MTFKATALMGDRFVVSGTDFTGAMGTTVLDGSQWNQVLAHGTMRNAENDFNEAVESFFAPLMEAAKLLEQEKVTDDIATLVLEEGETGNAGRPAVVANLTKDSIILRLIERGDTDRLMWVNSNLEVLDIQEVPTQLEFSTAGVAEREGQL